MSIFKTIRVRFIQVLCCLSLPPPALVLALPEAPWDDSPAPFVMRDESLAVAEDERIERVQLLQSASGFQVAASRTLRLTGPILGHPVVPWLPIAFWKLGGGHLDLAGASSTTGQIDLA